MHQRESSKGQDGELERVCELRKKVVRDLRDRVPTCSEYEERTVLVADTLGRWWYRAFRGGIESKIMMVRFTAEAWRAARRREATLLTAALALRRSLPADVVGIIVCLLVAA